MRGLVLAMLLALPAAAQQALYLPPPGTGVVVRLSNQREVLGTFLGERDGAVWVGVDGGEVGLEPRDIVIVQTRDNDDTEYRRRASRLGRDAAGWWTLAQWAKQRGLPGAAEEAAKKTVEAAPEHAGARALLGQEKVGGSWLDHDAAMKAKGYVEYRGEWLKKEEAAALERERRELRREERMEELLLLQRAQAYAPPPVVLPYPAPMPWWNWTEAPVINQPNRGATRYSVPLWRNQPFQPHFHEGYFRRAGF